MSWKFNPFTSKLDYYERSTAVGTSFEWVEEVPDGLINGLNDTYALTYEPISGSVFLSLQGQLFNSEDFTVSSTQLTMTIPIQAEFAEAKFIIKYQRQI